MLIINHRYFKSQAFYFEKTIFLNSPVLNHRNDSVTSERAFATLPGVSDSICEEPFRIGSSVLVWKDPPTNRTLFELEHCHYLKLPSNLSQPPFSQREVQ